MIKKLALLVFLLLGSVSACDDSGGSTNASSGADGEMMLRVSRNPGGDGSVPEAAYSRPPMLVLNSNGELVHGGSLVDIDPKRYPALQPALRVKLDEMQMDEVRSIIQKMGLAEVTHEINKSRLNEFPDRSTTKVIFNDKEGTRTYAAYALEEVAKYAPEDALANGLMELIETIMSFPATETYIPQQIEVTRAKNNIYALLGLTHLNDLNWPQTVSLPPEPEDIFPSLSCRAYSENEAKDLLISLENANTLTRWLVNEEDLFGKLLFRPLFPGEVPCGPPETFL
jgi:hypothetical protein